MKNHPKKDLQALLSKADIRIDGNRPWDMQVHDERLYRRIFAEGSLGLGESYMEGWWDAEALDAFFFRVLRAKLDEAVRPNLRLLLSYLNWTLFNMQSKARSKEVVRKHYNLDNALFFSFLDPYNQYTCGYFHETDDLNTAQEQKLEMICEKLHLSARDEVLDIGCGWGGFAKYAAEHYGCHVTGITISEEQYAYAQDFCRGLPVTIRLQDYRDIQQQYDKILVCGMIEHVGYKNHRRFMQIVQRSLRDNGLFLLHTIGSDQSYTHGEPWLLKYIFANSQIPSLRQLAQAAEGLFVMEDWHNFGAHYAKTLKAWFENFDRNWPSLQARYDEQFYRMWKYYLLSCRGDFLARKNQLWQIVFSKNGLLGGYAARRGSFFESAQPAAI